MNIDTKPSPQDIALFINHLDDIALRFAAACERAEAAVAESIGADCVPEDVNRIGEDLMGLLNQVRYEAEKQFIQLRTACVEAIAAGNTW